MGFGRRDFKLHSGELYLKTIKSHYKRKKGQQWTKKKRPARAAGTTKAKKTEETIVRRPKHIVPREGCFRRRELGPRCRHCGNVVSQKWGSGRRTIQMAC